MALPGKAQHQVHQRLAIEIRGSYIGYDLPNSCAVKIVILFSRGSVPSSCSPPASLPELLNRRLHPKQANPAPVSDIVGQQNAAQNAILPQVPAGLPNPLVEPTLLSRQARLNPVASKVIRYVPGCSDCTR